jgi:DNA (cytosine-5)-methyltransferase 1
MADGNQHSFHLPQAGTSRLRLFEIILDFFAGGGGASEGLRQALGRDPDIAVNHDADAIGMHAANHPYTRHHREDVWHIDPVAEVGDRYVGWFHASPDCTDHSQAKGGQPRDRPTRSLSWVVVKVAGKLHRVGRAPRIISLENVKQILNWGPLIAKRDPKTGRVLKRCAGGWEVAAPAERVPVRDQWLIPDKRKQGRTWRGFVHALERLGYTVEWRKLVASDFGAGTIRERLFMVARRDGEPITWPKPTHGKAAGLQRPIAAADSIDWSIPCRSIFDRPRPLAEKTMRRIARGVQRFVIDAAEPFIVGVGGRMGDTLERSVGSPMQTVTAKADSAVVVPTLAPFLTEHANGSNQRNMDATAPLGTVCAGVKGGHIGVVAPVLVQTAYGEGRPGGVQRRGSGAHDITDPVGTIAASSAGFAIAAPHLVKFRGDCGGVPADEPMPTVTSGAGAARPAGAAHALGVVSAFLEQANGGNYTGPGSDLRNPQPTICAQGSMQRLVTCTLSPEAEAGALRVAAFLMRYYGEGGQHGDLRDPLQTITTKDRLALVTVLIRGVPYVIVDIGMRMLEPSELYRAQGFPPEYIIDRTADGRKLSKSAQVKMVGNSVSPPPLRAIAEANLDRVAEAGKVAA